MNRRNVGTKQVFIKIASRAVQVRDKPEKGAIITCCLQQGQITQVHQQSTLDDILWYKVNSGWICSRDNTGFVCSEPSSEDQANRFWAVEFTNRKRLSAAIANLLTRSYGLDNARKISKQVFNRAKSYVKSYKPLLDLPELSIEALLVSLRSSTRLTTSEIFEFLKIAASYQSDPYKALIQIAEEADTAMNMRPSAWVKDGMGVLTTTQDTYKNDNFIMAAGMGDLKRFQKFLDEGQELTALHSG